MDGTGLERTGPAETPPVFNRQLLKAARTFIALQLRAPYIPVLKGLYP